MRLLFPIFFVLAGLVWFLVEVYVRKNSTKARQIISLTLFFSGIWALVYYFIFN